MRRLVFTTVACALAVFLSIGAGEALAEPVSLAQSRVDVQLMPEAEPGSNVLVVGARLPEGTPLPATVNLPVPDGANVFWAGEITGGPPELDIRREFSIVEGSAGRIIQFTVETTLSVQYDARYGAIRFSGQERETELAWRQSVEIAELSMALRLRPGTQLLAPEVRRPPQTNQAGERLYTLEPLTMDVGQGTTVTVAYRTGTAPPVQGEGIPIAVWLAAAIGVALLLLALVVGRQRKATPSAEE
ncbi:MAG: hypothetical protein M1617_00755 [Actinobacteria bacterium]|nr:hypothetical protein [Actinomycetota bacterium]